MEKDVRQKKARRTYSLKSENKRGILLFIVPVLLVYTLLFIVPMFQGVAYAFTDWDGINPNLHFIGLRNFIKIFTIDSSFLPAMGRTAFL